MPPGGLVPRDYVFCGGGADGGPVEVRLSELFAPGKDSLVIYSFMFPRDPGDRRVVRRSGKRGCSRSPKARAHRARALIDQFEGAADHVRQHVDLAVVARTPLPRLLRFAEERGWKRLRFPVLRAEHVQRRLPRRDARGHAAAYVDGPSPQGGRDPAFLELRALLRAHRAGSGSRHVGTIEPLWNVLDFTPEGRPQDWEEQLQYG